MSTSCSSLSVSEIKAIWSGKLQFIQTGIFVNDIDPGLVNLYIDIVHLLGDKSNSDNAS